MIDKKLSENRIKAFYSVLHELIRNRKKIQRLERKVFELTEKINQLNLNHKKIYYYNYKKPLIYNPSSDITKILAKIKNRKNILVINPENDNFLSELNILNLNFTVLTEDSLAEEFKIITSKILICESYFKFENYTEFDTIIYYSNLSLLFPELILNFIRNLKNFSSPDSLFMFKYSNEEVSEVSPFKLKTITQIDKNLLENFLKEYEFNSINFFSSEINTEEYVFFSNKKIL